MRRAVVVAAALSLVALTGCAGDEEPEEASGPVAPGAVEVVAQDIKFPRDRYDATAGNVNFHYRNDGSILHTLVIEDVDGFKLEVARKGQTDQGSVQLAAGTYTIYCDVAGHREAGMEATLVVA